MNRGRALSVLQTLIFSVALAGPSHAQERVPTAAVRLKAQAPEFLARCGVPALSIALADSGGVTWSRAWGECEAGSGRPAGVETAFAAASLSKPVFAYAVLKLVDQGVVELDRPLAEYAELPDLAHDPRGARITVRQVLSHSTGLPNWRPRGGRLDFVADPGARWGYSGEGFVLLAHVLEQRTGASLDELARDLVFEPLGMESASFSGRPRVGALAVPHDADGRPLPLGEARENAAASLVCTAADYARFLAALLRGEGLSPELVDEMRRPQVETSPGVAWGLGAGIEEQPDGPALWQWGHNTGYRAFAWLSPARGEAFVFLCNGDGGMLGLRDLLRLATGTEHHPAVDHLGYERWDSPARALRMELAAILQEGGAQAALERMEELRPARPTEAFGEGLLNTLGYSLLRAEPPRVADVVVLFRRNTELFPRSSNPWDSLGEALLAAGETQAALVAYRRSVELAPDHAEGTAVVARLEAELGPKAPDAGLVERITDYLAAWERRGELAGVVLVARGDEVLFRRAYGLADVERGVPCTPETRFHVASITKTFTAAAVLLLESTGDLALSDPLTRFLPGYPRGDEIRIEHLLGHSSGIPDHHGLPGFEERTKNGLSLEELVRWQSTFPLEYDPGTDDRYVNSGYAVLARVVEVVSGQTFPTFVRENLLEPLGMNATGEVDASYRGARGTVPGPPPAGRRPVPDRDWSYSMGSGSMASTADDLLRWLRAVEAKTLVDVQRTRWPYGWGKERYGRFESLEQTGMHSGFTATISVVPEARLHVVHLSSLQAGLPFQRVHRDLVRILLGEAVEPPPPLVRVSFDPEAGARLAGTYRGEGEWHPRLVADAEGLWWRWRPDDAPRYLAPVGPDRFLLVEDGCTLVFTASEGEAAPRFELHQPWQPEGPHPTFVRTP